MLDQHVASALEAILKDIRETRESEDGTDQYPDETYLIEDVEKRIDAILNDFPALCGFCWHHTDSHRYGAVDPVGCHHCPDGRCGR